MLARLARPRVGEKTSSLAPGSIVAGKYRIESVLGEGGMGVVYAAHHEMLDQRVALKVLFEDATRDEEAAARFLQEARSAARLQSEHAVRVMDIDTLESGVPYIVMEYLEGLDLGQLLEQDRVLSHAAVVDYALQALEAIAQAHAQGIVHRDLKPSNLFLTTAPDGSRVIKVLDFGISKATFGRVSSLTSSRSVLGSPPYMSPEQVRSPRSVDTRTDVWSMGVSLYELLTGKMPFEAEEVGELFAAILEREPTALRASRPEIPGGLEAAILRCLAKKREARFADVSELARALAPFGTGRQVGSVEKIHSTLLRGEEIGSLRRPVVSSGISLVERPEPTSSEARAPLEDATQPDPPASDARPHAPELSPTASTVKRSPGLFPRVPGSTRRRMLALGGALVAVVLLVVFAWRSTSRRTAAAVPAAAAIPAPPLVAPPPAVASDPAPPAPAVSTETPALASPAAAPLAPAKPKPRAAKPASLAAPPVRSAPPIAPAPPKRSPVMDDDIKQEIRTF